MNAEQAHKFCTIKKKMGVKNNTEVIRSLINLRFNEIQPNEVETDVELEVTV